MINLNHEADSKWSVSSVIHTDTLLHNETSRNRNSIPAGYSNLQFIIPMLDN